MNIGAFRIESKLIFRPRQQPHLQRTLFGVVTALAWAAYLYLWAPLVTLLMWIVGVRTAYVELYLARHSVDTGLLLTLLSLALGAAVLLIGWAEYNRRRFQGKDRRGRHGDVGREEVAQAFGANPVLAERMLDAKTVLLKMSDRAVPLEAMVGRALPVPVVPSAALET